MTFRKIWAGAILASALLPFLLAGAIIYGVMHPRTPTFEKVRFDRVCKKIMMI